MSYTLEQKREASQQRRLWYRYPLSKHESDRAWDLLVASESDNAMLTLEGAAYFIGPTPPRVLSELEVELLEACKRLIGSLGVMIGDPDNDGDIIFARAAIQKAESTP